MNNMKAQRHPPRRINCGTKARRGDVVIHSPATLASSHQSSPRAFSLIEVLLAIFILGIGVIGIAALFPAGIAQQQRSVDDVMGPLVANNALSVLRSKLKQDDFGSFEDFNDSPPEFNRLATITGDWFWRRPAVMYEDDTSNSNFKRDERGAIDIFGYVTSGFWSQGNPSLSEVPVAAEDVSGTGPIPFNPAKWYDPVRAANGQPQLTPSIVFTQGERMYPMSPKVRDDNRAAKAEPQYYWDCMFRKFQGKVLVAVFVYRIIVPGGEDYVYSVPPADPASNLDVPIVPHRLSLVDVTNPMPWGGQSIPSQDALDATGSIPDYPLTAIWETDPNSPLGTGPWSDIGPTPIGAESEPVRFAAPDRAWQVTGQWLIDQNNNIHRVLVGREKDLNHPVELVDHIPQLTRPNGYSGVSPYFYDRDPNGNGIWNENNEPVGSGNVATDIWYLPRYVEVTIGGATITISIIPVFATVEEL